MNEPTTLEIEDRPGGFKIVHIRGDLDSMGTRTIDAPFKAVPGERGQAVIVDLSHVGFISSAGMAMLLVKGKQLRQNEGKLVIAAPSKRVFEVLSLAGFHELFSVYPTTEAALEALGTPRS